MTLTATQLKQQTYLMDNVSKEDIVITKRSRPFAVLVEIQRYKQLIHNDKKDDKQKKLDALKTLGSYNLGGKDSTHIKEEIYDNH
jgi:prevent-host-death family protein